MTLLPDTYPLQIKQTSSVKSFPKKPNLWGWRWGGAHTQGSGPSAQITQPAHSHLKRIKKEGLLSFMW